MDCHGLGGGAEPLVVVSADGHIGPRLVEDLRPYCPLGYLDEFDAFTAHEREAGRASLDRRFSNPASAEHPAGRDRAARAARNSRAGHHDMAVRRADMDADGVAAEVIFHGSQNGEPFPFIATDTSAYFYAPTGDRRELELVGVGMHMYNQWLADVIADEAARHVGLAHLPMWDVDKALLELEWARSVGLAGVNFPAPRPGIAEYDDPVWEPFWATCAALAMPLSTHTGGGDPARWSGPHRHIIMSLEAAGWPSRQALQRMVFSGVFERHPALRLIFTEFAEQPSTWWKPTSRTFDAFYTRLGWEIEDILPRPPSEYLYRNVFMGASFMHRAPEEPALAVRDGYVANMMWGSDYPHHEGTFLLPETEGDSSTRLALRLMFAGLPEGDVRRMAGETAAEVYGLDLATLSSVAKRIEAPPPETLVVPEFVPRYWTGAE